MRTFMPAGWIRSIFMAMLFPVADVHRALASEIDPRIDAGRPRCVRHRLAHAWRPGRGMQVLLFPLRTFGDGGRGELVDGSIPARVLVNPIAACINHARYLAIAGNIFAVIPAVP